MRLAKCKHYTDLFDEVKDCKSYWKLVKSATCSKSTWPILGIRGADGRIKTSDQGKAEILNEHFSTIDVNVTNELPVFSQEDHFTHITRITPTVTNIDLTYDGIAKGLSKLKVDKACRPDRVAPKLRKLASNALIPYLMSVYSSSASCNLVPDTWKFANVSSLFKSGDETDKLNYRPISLLCIPGKLMETAVASTVTTHVTDHDLGNIHQWAYKKGHSTELLLVKMTEDWRRALDNLVVGIVFVDFLKAFDSISHHILLQKLQGLGIAGDLWCWIKDYLSNRSQVTIVNGCSSASMPVKFGVPQLFSLFCNDLPDTVNEGDGEIHMYADDTTLYVIAYTRDIVATTLNNILSQLYDWCCRNSLNPQPGKTEFMLLT